MGRGEVPTGGCVHHSQLQDFKTWDWPGNEASPYVGQSSELIVKIFTIWFRTQIPKQLHVDDSKPYEEDKGHEDDDKETCPVSKDLEEEFLYC